MSSMRRTLGLLLGSALLTLAFAVPASAEYTPPANFKLPYGDTDAKDWQAVIAKDLSGGSCWEEVECAYQTEETIWDWKAPSSFSTGKCASQWEGSFANVGPFGYLFTSSVAWAAHESFWYCQHRNPAPRWEAPGPAEEMMDFWQGELCRYKPTGETWLRQVTTFKQTPTPTIDVWVSYGEVLGSASEGGGLNPETLSFTKQDVDNWHVHSADFPLSAEVDLYPAEENEEEVPCQWYELS